jgi:hypothetical protein
VSVGYWVLGIGLSIVEVELRGLGDNRWLGIGLSSRVPSLLGETNGHRLYLEVYMYLYYIHTYTYITLTLFL